MSANEPSILLVEDDANFGPMLRDYLELHDYHVTLCRDGHTGSVYFRQALFDLCILDVMMPYKDGFTLAKEIKTLRPDMPVIFLTAKSLKADVLEGFRLGADDYIVKPFDSEVLIHKIKAILKRYQPPVMEHAPAVRFTIGEYVFDAGQRVLSRGVNSRQLSPKEAHLLQLLCLRMNQVLSREEALIKIWNEDSYFTTRSMDVFIAKLREYLKEDSSVEIINLHRSGFRLVAPEIKTKG